MTSRDAFLEKRIMMLDKRLTLVEKFIESRFQDQTTAASTGGIISIIAKDVEKSVVPQPVSKPTGTGRSSKDEEKGAKQKKPVGVKTRSAKAPVPSSSTKSSKPAPASVKRKILQESKVELDGRSNEILGKMKSCVVRVNQVSTSPSKSQPEPSSKRSKSNENQKSSPSKSTQNNKDKDQSSYSGKTLIVNDYSRPRYNIRRSTRRAQKEAEEEKEKTSTKTASDEESPIKTEGNGEGNQDPTDPDAEVMDFEVPEAANDVDNGVDDGPQSPIPSPDIGNDGDQEELMMVEESEIFCAREVKPETSGTDDPEADNDNGDDGDNDNDWSGADDSGIPDGAEGNSDSEDGEGKRSGTRTGGKRGNSEGKKPRIFKNYVRKTKRKFVSASTVTLTPDIAKTDPDRKECPICKKHIKHEYFAIHIETHTKERVVKCPDCDKMYYSRPTMLKHWRTHQPEKYGKKCRMCDKIFTQSGKLLAHERFCVKRALAANEEVDPEIIEDIKTRSGVQWNVDPEAIKARVNMDPSERKQCPHCKKHFRMSIYERHVLTHSIPRNWVCSMCDKSYYHKNDLKRHIGTEHVKVSCEQCSLECENRAELRIHKTTCKQKKSTSKQVQEDREPEPVPSVEEKRTEEIVIIGDDNESAGGAVLETAEVIEVETEDNPSRPSLVLIDESST